MPIRTFASAANHSRSLRAISFGAKFGLAIIALFSLASYLLTSGVHGRQSLDTQAIEAAGKERSLCERLVMNMHIAASPSEPLSDRQDALDLLRDTEANWRLKHEFVMNFAATERSPALSKAIRLGSASYSQLIAASRSARQNPLAIANQLSQIRKLGREFISHQEGVTRELEESILDRSSQTRNLSLGLFIAMILLLIAEHWMIYRPLLKRVRQSFEAVHASYDQLESARNELASQNLSLQSSRQALSEAVHHAEDMARLSRFSASRFEELFAGLPIAAFTFDASGTVFEWNREAESLFGISAANALGNPIPKLIARREDETEYNFMIQGVFDGAHLYNIERTIRRPNGEERLVHFNAFPLRDPEGEINGGVCSMVDVTEQRRAEAQLRRSERRFRTIVEDLPTGAVLIEGQQILLNRYIEELTGYRKFDLVSLDEWFELLFPGAAQDIRLQYEQDRAQGFPVSRILPLTRMDGEVRNVEFRAVRTDNREIWLLTDITASLLEARRIEESESFFRTTMEALTAGVAYLDANERITMMNPRGAEVLGLTVGQILRNEEFPADWYCVDEGMQRIEPKDYVIRRAFRDRAPIENEVNGASLPNGEFRWICINATPIFVPDSEEPVGAIASFTDITEARTYEQQLVAEMIKTSETAIELELSKMELETAMSKLKLLATTDGLTEIHNHRSFQEEFEKQFSICRRTETPLSILLLDVDNFKNFNDDFGHVAGDQVLRRVAAILEDTIESHGFAARYGGEEFVGLLPGSDVATAMMHAEAVRKAIEGADWPGRRVTVSIGVATLNEHASRESMVSEADSALYQAKSMGRNRTRHAQDFLRAA